MREFAETKNFLDNILESSTKYSIIGKDLDHRILSWNRGAVLNYGYTQEEIIGKDSGMLHASEDIDSGAVDNLLAEAHEKGLAEASFNGSEKTAPASWPALLSLAATTLRGTPSATC